jgi:KipI family sensor histidine kinase inhibitor
MRILPMGPAAVLVEDPPEGPAAWSAGVRASEPTGLVDVVPGASTVLVRFVDERACRDAVARLGLVQPRPPVAIGEEVVIPVRYDGPDLDAIAAAAGWTPDEVVGAHSGADYRVAFCGFAPGFGYLTGLPDRLHLPRRPTPRTQVPAGSVAIAAGYAAVYPAASPGGWHVLGTTELVLFDPDRDPPALLTPGTHVRFVAA